MGNDNTKKQRVSGSPHLISMSFIVGYWGLRFCSRNQECPKFLWFQLYKSAGLQVCRYVGRNECMHACVCDCVCMYLVN